MTVNLSSDPAPVPPVRWFTRIVGASDPAGLVAGMTDRELLTAMDQLVDGPVVNAFHAEVYALVNEEAIRRWRAGLALETDR